jgi:colanic acid biosynthesis glycosyl transferase WcaI
MKILIVSQYFWPENFRITDLASGLIEMGHSVDVLTGMPNYPGGKLFDGYKMLSPSYESHAGIRIFRIPLIPRRQGRSLDLAFNYLSFAISGCVFGPLRCGGNYDCILAYEPSPITVGLPAIVLRSVKGAPLLFWVQDLWPESLSATGAITSNWILERVKTLVRFIYSRCDRILVQAEAFKAPIEALGVDSEKLDYFPNSAEALYQPVTLSIDAPEHTLMPDGFRVMFAGNIGAAQDFPTIIKAAELLKSHADIHFIILGSGRKQAWAEAQVEAKGLAGTFHMLGRYPVEAMPRFFSLADAMLVTLKKDLIFERTIPAKVQSYMACARPVLAALDGEGARVITESGAGIACGAENPRELAKAILELYNLPETRRKEMGENGLNYFNANFERTLLLKRLEKMMMTLQRRAAK